MKKSINLAQTIIAIYLLAILFVLLVGELGYHDPITIFLILPSVYVIAIWEYLYIKQLKRAYKTAHTLYDKEIVGLDNEIVNKDKQIKNYQLLDEVRIQRIRKLESDLVDGRNEIIELKKDVLPIDNNIPFNEDNDNEEELHLCHNCGHSMREAKTMWICDRCKKRRKKSDL